MAQVLASLHSWWITKHQTFIQMKSVWNTEDDMKAFLLGRGVVLVSTIMVRDIHCLSIDVISLVSNTWLSAFLYLQCNPKTFFMSALWKRIKHSYVLKFDTEAAKRFQKISDSDCIVSIGERAPALQQLGKESSHCSGELSAHLCPKLVHLPFLVSFSSSSSAFPPFPLVVMSAH